MQTLAPVLEGWLVAAPARQGTTLASGSAKPKTSHSRAEIPDAQVIIDSQGAEAIRLTLDEHHEDLDGYPGLLSL